MKFKAIIALIPLTFNLCLIAGEPDHFTNKHKVISDSLSEVNREASLSLQEAIQNANKKTNNCDEKVLYEESLKYFGNHIRGKFTRKIISSKEIEKKSVSVYKSVYRDWKFYDGTIVASPIVKQLGVAMSPVLNINGFEVGADKFEHLFGQGFYYFTLHRLEKKSLDESIALVTKREKESMGGSRWQTGILSYGDLAANFNGYRFWNHFLQKEDDLLGKDHNVGPFVRCENQQWVKVKDIDFAEYFDDSVDESINCSTFPTKSNLEKFTKRIHELGFACPIDPARRDDLKVKYGSFAEKIINFGTSRVTDL